MREVKLWVDKVEDPSVLINQWVVGDTDRVDLPPPGFFHLAPDENYRWESRQIETCKPEPPINIRNAVMEAIGEASMCWDDVQLAGIFDSEHAASVGERLIARLGLDGDEELSCYPPGHFDPVEPPEPEQAPQWFLDWRMSQYRADVCDLADRIDRQKATVTDTLTRAHSRMAQMEQTLARFGKRFKVRKSVLAAERAAREEEERYDD